MNPAEFATLEQAEQSMWWFRGMRRILFDMLDPLAAEHKFERVLEAGAGTGYMARLLSERYGWKMFAADLAFEGISRSAGTVLRPVQADIARCPFRNASFDAVLSLDVLIHFPRGAEIEALREFARVLRPGGLLLLRVAALDILHSRHSEFTHERQRFTRTRLMGVAEAAGFRVLRSTYANSLLLPVALAKFRIWEPLLRRPPSSGTAPVPGWLDRLLYLPLAAEAALIKRGIDFPAGQSLILIARKI